MFGYITIRKPGVFPKSSGRLGRRSVSGFTLLELLVVIGIISLLLSIMVPALGRARSIAKQVVCQSNLRQWSVAFELYANNNNDYYPHIDGSDRQSSAADLFGWIEVLPPMWGDKPWGDYERWQHPTDDTFFQCPAAQLVSDKNLYSYHPLRNGYFSYAMNSCLELDENCWHHPDDTSGPMPSFLKRAKINRPGEVYLLFDQLLDPLFGYDGEHPNRSAGKHCGSYPKAFSARHSRGGDKIGGSILFCDGHVQWQSTVWKSDWPDDLEVPPRTDRNWYPYPP